MTRPLRVTREHLLRFANASGDRNPLHIDDLYARATPYGRCMAQGALITIAALGALDEATLRSVGELHVQFKQPVFPDQEYAISVVASDSEIAQVEVVGGGRVAVAISVVADASAAPPPDVGGLVPSAPRSSPQEHTLQELTSATLSVDEAYGCDIERLTVLAEDLAAGHVPHRLLLWLSAASYTVGMVVPGRDALFVAARIVRSAVPRSGALTCSVTAVDDRTGLVVLDVGLDQHDASAQMTLQTFLRPPVPPPDRATIERYVAPSAKLAGRNILVVGGSRGLGAGLSGTLAMQGATVWIGFAHSRPQAEGLRSEFGAERIQLLQFDAENPEDTRRAVGELRSSAGVIDGVVLCAAPPLYETALRPEASVSTLRFLHSSLAMALVPLAEVLDILAQDGWLVMVSSSGLDDPPELWPHYTIAKAALEGVAAYCERHTSARVLVARAPGMLTDSTNTPLARLSAVPKEEVAAAVVRWVTSTDDSRPNLLSGAELTSPAPRRA